MRYVALLLVLLVFAFLLFVRPLLKDYSVDLTPGSLKLDRKSLSLSGLTLYAHLGKKRVLFLHLGKLKLSWSKGRKPTLELRDSSLIFVNLKKPRRRERPVRLRRFTFVRNLNLKAENLYLSFLSYRSSLTTFVKKVSLQEKRIKGEADFYYLSSKARNEFSLLVKDTQVKREAVYVKEVLVESPLYEFRGMGIWRWGEGEFSAQGYIKEIDTKHLRIPRIQVSGGGTVDLEGVKIKAQGYSPKVLLKERKEFKDVKATASLEILFGVKNHIRGRIWNEEVEADYVYRLFPEREVVFDIRRARIDEKLLGLKQKLRGSVRGEVFISLKEERLELGLESETISFENTHFKEGYLSLNLNMGTNPRGKFRLGATGREGSVYSEGSFSKNALQGVYELRDYPLPLKDMAGFLELSGSFEKEKDKPLASEGRGSLKALKVKGIPLGSPQLTYSMKGEELKVYLLSPSYEGEIRKVGEEVSAKFGLSKLRTYYEDLSVEIDSGKIEFLLHKDDVHLSVFVNGGRLSYGAVKLEGLQGVLYTNPEKEFGFLGVKIGRLRIKDFTRERGYLFGKYEGGIVEGLYEIKGLVGGSYRARPDRLWLRTEGNLNLRRGDWGLSCRFWGKLEEDRGEGGLTGQVSFKDKGVPVNLSFKAFEDWLYLRVEPTSYREENWEAHVGSLELEGKWSRLKVSTGASYLKVFGKEVFRLGSGRGYLSLDRREFFLGDLKLKGALEGKLSVFYRDRLEVSSRGRVNLGALSLLVGSLIKSRLEGHLNYSAGYSQGQLYLELFSDRYFALRSNYLALPMLGSVNLSVNGSRPQGYIYIFSPVSKLLVGIEPEGDKINVGIKGTGIPLRFASEGMRAIIYTDAKGKVEVKSLEDISAFLDTKVSGYVKLSKSDSFSGGNGEIKLPFKFLLSITPGSPIRVLLPEGFVNLKPGGVITNGSGELMYAVSLNLVSGEVNYFGRDFFIRRGWFLLEKKNKEKKYINLSITNVEDNAFIYIDLIGELPVPKIYLRSDPPMDRREILTKLVLGGITEGVIPVASSLITEFTHFTELRRNISGLLGLDIRFITHTGSQGDMGLNVLVSKKLSNMLRLEYQQSTLKDPWATFYGASVSIEPLGVSLGTRVYSDNTRGFRLRIRRKFNF